MALYAIKVKYEGTWWACLLEEADSAGDAANCASDTLAALGMDRTWMERYDLHVEKVTTIELEWGGPKWLVS